MSQGHAAPREPRRRRTLWIPIGVLAVVLLLLLGAVAAAGITSETATERQSFPPDDVELIEVAVAAGDVQIVSELRDDIAVTTHLTSNVWSRAASRVALSDGSLSITGNCERTWLVLGCSARYEIALPRAATALARVNATAGTIEILSYAGSVQVMTEAGRIQLLSFAGQTAALSTTAGRIVVQAERTPTSITATTTAGGINILVPDDAYRVQTNTTAGNVDVSIPQDPQADRRISATTTTGDIRISAR